MKKFNVSRDSIEMVIQEFVREEYLKRKKGKGAVIISENGGMIEKWNGLMKVEGVFLPLENGYF